MGVASNRPSRRFSGIYGIVDLGTSPEPVIVLDAMLAAGIAVVQFRAKAGVDRDLVRRLHARARAAGALLIVNDDLDAALDADGLHVGQEDLALCDVRELRRRLGARTLGISCGVPEEARAAEAAGADYVGVGPFAVTGSKPDAGAAIGVAGVAAVVGVTRLPVVAIGGIGPDEIPEVVRSGAAMAAVISAIARAPDAAEAARTLVRRWARAAS